MKSLYNIQSEYLQLAEALMSNGGEVTPELEKELAINKEELEQKSTNYALLIKNFEGNENTIDAEIKRLTDLKKGITRTREKLSENIFKAMQAFDISKIEGDLVHLQVQKNPPSVEIYDESLLPATLKTKIPESYRPDKIKIKAELQAGNLVLGAKLVTDSKRLKIK